MMHEDIEITGIYYYPVKSMGAVATESALLTRAGLQYDRWWMVIDPSGTFVSQRQIAELATIQPRIEGDCMTLTRLRPKSHFVVSLR